MKKLYSILAVVLFTANVFAQSPEKMSYQSVVRDAGNNLMTNTQVGLQIRILQGSATGTEVYSEIQTPTTNANGLLSVEIGGQTGFDTITWANGPYFIETSIDPAGGSNYTITGTSQLLSVPYALHAKTAETVTDFSLTGNETAFNGWDKNQYDDFDGNYESLTGAPTNLSQFTNDAGYITSAQSWGPGEINSANYSLYPISPMKTFRGRLTDETGIPISGIITVSMNAYNQASNGTPLWSEIQDTEFNDGFFKIELGKETNGYDDLFINGQEIYLEFSIGGGETLAPRIKMTGTGYAAVAGTVDWENVTNHPAVDGSETHVTAGTNVTVTGTGTTGDPYVINATSGSATYNVGDFAQGGIVFWVDETGEHGLVCAKSDQSSGVRWYAGTYTYTMAKGDGPYAGELNTAIIIANQSNGDSSTYAARICNELQITENGKTYGDWYLPSKEELNLMYQNKTTIDATAQANGGVHISEDIYWGSTEYSNNKAVSFDFYMGTYGYDNKNETYYNVRAVRAF